MNPNILIWIAVLIAIAFSLYLLIRWHKKESFSGGSTSYVIYRKIPDPVGMQVIMSNKFTIDNNGNSTGASFSDAPANINVGQDSISFTNPSTGKKSSFPCQWNGPDAVFQLNNATYVLTSWGQFCMNHNLDSAGVSCS